MRDLTKLHSASIFRKMPKADVEAYLDDCPRRMFRKKQIAFTPRQDQDSIYLVLSGRIRAYLSYPNGKEFTLTILEQGDVYNGHTRAFGLALEDSEIALIPVKKFKQMLLTNPMFTMSVIAVLGDALKHSIDIIENLAFLDVNERLYDYLIETAQERGVPIKDGVLVEFGLTHEEIATTIGSTRQAVSSFFNSLQKEGLLRVGKGRVTVHDLDRLTKLYNSSYPKNSD